MEWIAIAVTWFASNVNTIVEVIGAAAIVATLTPNKSDDAIVAWILKVVNFLGANVGKAENKDV